MSKIDASTRDLQQHRSHFGALANKAYFNYGAQGPLPAQAVAAIVASYDSIQMNGPFVSSTFDRLKDEIEQTKDALGDLLNADRRSIVLTQSVTEGCNIVMWGIEWQAGDHLLLTDCEHTSIVAIAQRIAARHNIEVSAVQLEDSSVDAAQAISEAIRPQTKLVVLSHALWNTGKVLPLADIAAICQRKGVKLLVDGAQSAGAIPLDMKALGVDFYAITGHKWLCGPEGVGALYIRDGLIDKLQPTFVGWRGVRFAPKDGVDGTRFETATTAFPLFAGLRAALALHSQWGTPAQRYNQIKENVGYLREQLSKVPGIKFLCDDMDSGVVSFTVANMDAAALVAQLESEKIILRALVHPVCVRACVHYLTSKSDIDRLVAAITA
jgi:L-cysteine/cystine lyase